MNERKEHAFSLGYRERKSHDKTINGVNYEIIERGAFEQYKDLSEIAENIAKEMLKDSKDGGLVYQNIDNINKTTYENIINEGLTFFMSPEDKGRKRSGLLSICPAVLTAIKIWEALPQNSPSRKKLFTNIEKGIDAIFKIIYRGEKCNTPIFDASPYESDAFSESKSYIDSITWAVPVFLRIMNLTKKKKIDSVQEESIFGEDRRQKAKILAKWCLEYINDSLIIGEDDKPIGWSFTKLENTKGAESSIYFNYAASTVYLSFYVEYKEIIEALRTIEAGRKGLIEDEGGDYEIKLSKLKGEYWKDKKNLESELKYIENALKEWENKAQFLKEKLENYKNEEKSEETQNAEKNEQTQNELKNIDKTIDEFEKIKKALDHLLKEQYDMYKINSLFEFNNGYNIAQVDDSQIKVGQLSLLKSNLEQVAASLWNSTGKKLEKEFLYDDPKATTATEEAIESGGQTNALFTGLLQISIILNSAYDVKIRTEKGLDEYEKMQDVMLLHVQKTQRFFNKLKKEGKSFGVDTLIIRFMESTGGRNDNFDSNLAEKLRKAYIRVFPLTPMLLKTNNLLSEYVIRYPQKQMGDSLFNISEDRFVDVSSKKPHWLWDKNIYHAITNYYYVDAIFEFYRYYEEYESNYVKHYGGMLKEIVNGDNFEKSARKHYQEETEKRLQEIEKYQRMLEAEKKATEEANDRAKEKEEMSQNAGLLVNFIKEIIKTSDFFDSEVFFKKIIKGFRVQLAKELVERKKWPEDYHKKLSTPIGAKEDDSLFYLFQALIADIILPSAIDAKTTDSGRLVKDFGFGENKPEAVAYEGTRRLINGLINEVFVNVFSGVNCDNSKYNTKGS